MTEKEIADALTKMHGILKKELETKRKYCTEEYERLLDDIRYDVPRQTSADRSICFEHNNGNRLISMAECTGFLRGLEFAMDISNIALYSAYLEKKKEEE